MTAVFSSNNCNYYVNSLDTHFLCTFEGTLTLGLLLYSIQHLQNITTILKQRQEVIDACSTNAALAQNFPAIDRKVFLICALSEFLCMASSCCFALAKLYGIDTKFYGHDVTPFHLSLLEMVEWRTMNRYYTPNIDTLMNSISL